MKLSKKLLAVPALLLTLCGCYKIEFNLITYSGYYAQHLPHKKGTNPELIFTLKYLYYLEKPKNSNLDYDYDNDGVNSIIVNEEFSVSGYRSPIVYDSSKYDRTKDAILTSYRFNEKGVLQMKRIRDITKNGFQYSKSSESKKEAENYVERAITPILRVQPKPKLNLQWLFNLIYQRKFE